MKFFVSPQHARLSIKADKASAYVVFCMLRENVKRQDASSHYTKTEVKSLLISLGFSARKWTRIFDAGNGIFWNMEYKRLYLRSYAKVTQNLERVTGEKIAWNMRYCREIECEVTAQDTSASIGAKLYLAWFMARGEITIARDTLSDIFGLSHDQQRHYESLLDGVLLIKHNYAHIDSAKYADNPQLLPEHTYTFGYERFTDDKVTVHEAIQYQLPNTFVVSSGNGNRPTTTDASVSLTKAIRASKWHTDSYLHRQCSYSHTWRDFERNKGQAEYIRAYSQGIKKLWLSSQYI